MKITQRSLGFSLFLHASLLAVGIFWLVLTSSRSGATPSTPEVGKVKITQVKLAKIETPEVRPEPPKPSRVRPTVAVRVPPRISRPTLEAEEPSKVVSQPQAPVKSPARFIEVANEYPKAASPSKNLDLGPRQRVANQSHRPREAAPLWSPSSTPSASPTPSPTSNEAGALAAGQQNGQGVVVEAYPIDRVRVDLRSGEIEVRCEIAADGSTTSVSILRSTGDVQTDNEVLKYLRTVRWHPKTVNGIPVPDAEDLDFTATPDD